MSEFADPTQLLNGAGVVDQVEDVELPGGLKVRVRGLTRYELLANGKGADDSAVIEARNVATCMVEPKMSISQVERWQKASQPAVIGKVTDAIRRLSGLGDGAQKSSVLADGDDGS